MPSLHLLSVLLLLLLAFDVTQGKLTNAQLEAAFSHDGFTVKQWTTYQGQRGALAEAKNATVLSNGQPKRAYYVEGNGREMGFLLGTLAANETLRMSRDYVDRFVPSLVVPKWQHAFSNSSVWNELIDLLATFVVRHVKRVWTRQVGDGVYPKALVDEMDGLLQGASKVLGSDTPGLTLDRIITLNTGMDWISALAFSGRWAAEVRAFAKERRAGMSDELWRVLHDDEAELFRVPVYCDAFGVLPSASKSGAGAFMARDFQLPTCDVFQEVNAMIVYNPTDGRNPVVSVTAPGIVGSITAMNAKGVTMGVDTLRSATGNASAPGLNAVMLVRHVADTATSLDSALQVIAEAKRGTPFLYPVCDADGDCAVVEAGPYTSGSYDSYDPFKYVQVDDKVKALLPNASFVRAHNSASAFMNGSFVRRYGYELPAGYLELNKGLFDAAGVPFNASAWGEDGLVFPSWQAERVAQKKLMNMWFPPLRGQESLPAKERDFIVVSNMAIVPEVRLAQMGLTSDLLAKDQSTPAWRYDRLNEMLLEQHGSIDSDVAKDIITFLSPDRTPGYWNGTIIPHDPMSAEVEGAISVADIDNRVLHTKAGYWADNWTFISLTGYLG